MLQMEDNEYFEDDNDEETFVGKIHFEEKYSTNQNNFQIHKMKENMSPITMNINVNVGSASEYDAKLSATSNKISEESPSQLAQTINISDKSQLTAMEAAVNRLQERRASWSQNGVRKENSPMVFVTVKNKPTVATIDEGSEINCLDESFAARTGILYIPTLCTATAAGSNNMKLAGQTIEDIDMQVEGASRIISLKLGKMVVVKNLGVDTLIGEPGKADNKIVTIPHEKVIKVLDDQGKTAVLPYWPKNRNPNFNYAPCKAMKTEVIFPNHSIEYQLPPRMQQESVINISPSRSCSPLWFNPKNVNVTKDGTISIMNETNIPICISKNEHFADIRTCKKVDVEPLKPTQVRKVYDIGNTDVSHLIPAQSLKQESFISEVNIDPDNQLSPEWKHKFKETCLEFSDIINPRPGKYNGFYGRVDNSINFASVPPPTVRAHLPNYSADMLKILGDKMDKLEEWGVLVKPEDIGVVPEFVVPSMLMPKPEKGEWRLVTDFTPLNIHIKKLETIAPTIQEAKNKLAKYNYHIQLDLSNYFYQGGMRVEDCQYLATPHPFKGLRLYVCEPQGLRNASEHAYERLARVYGDLCAEEKMTRMADGLFVLGDTLEDLLANFQEVLSRARLCGMTFKPSKVVIAPINTVLFGWQKVGAGWRPTTHTISPLTKADPPSTVKKLRSWLGAYKQLTECVPNHAIVIGPLEQIVGGRASAERITWTDALLEAFIKSKESLNNINTVYVPKPTDTLHTYSDWSAKHKAAGGRLEIHRTLGDGSIKKLLGGHFSCRVSNYQKNWLPCEGEALSARLVVEHFSPLLRESKNKVTHHTDSMPTVQAWKRSKTGAFSSSARISTFLTGMSALDIELVFKPGVEMYSSDYYSRNPVKCENKRCQICKFAYEMETQGDEAIPMIATVTVEDIEQGRMTMPFTQRSAWLKVQKNDKMHQQLAWLIDSSQTPEKKKTRGDHTVLKRLHNLYKNGMLQKSRDGLITVTHEEPGRGSSQAISVPTSMYPGLIQALHLKLLHPSKMQLLKLSSRYFYSPGTARIVEEVTSNCNICAALKQLPTERRQEVTTLCLNACTTSTRMGCCKSLEMA